jgi:hypothetical protein
MIWKLVLSPSTQLQLRKKVRENVHVAVIEERFLHCSLRSE